MNELNHPDNNLPTNPSSREVATKPTEPKLTMTANELFDQHPLPWSHHLLLIKDANGNQVIHTGGLYSERGRQYEGKYLSGLNALFVELVNARISPASAALVVDNLQRRLYEECVTANWDPERKNTFAEEIAHLHEELSEAFRAWRRYKDCEVREVNGKLEGVPIEFADALIGMFYNAEVYGFDLLAAVERKHQFNLTRNYVAEGRQLHAPAAATAAPVGHSGDAANEAANKIADYFNAPPSVIPAIEQIIRRCGGATPPSSTSARAAAEEIETHLGILPFSLIDQIHERRQTIYRGIDYRLSPDVSAKLKTDLDYLMALVIALRPEVATPET